MRARTPSPTEDYISQTFISHSPAQTTAYASGEALSPGMQLSAQEGKLLSVLARLCGARRILEIGTFVGYSTLWLARALPEDGEIVTLEARPEHAALAREHFQQAGETQRIRLIEGRALESLAQLSQQGECFDMLFIDAAKSEYLRYLELAEPMLRSGALVVGDNTLLFGHMTGEPRQRASDAAVQAMQAFHARLSDASRYDATLLSTYEGMTIAVKR